MNKIKNYIFLIILILAQSTFYNLFSVNFIRVDIVLIALIAFSYSDTIINGQFYGFITGIIEDIISISPLGFNGLIKTIIGFSYGRIKGKIFLDPILMPIIFVFIGTIYKYIISIIILLFLEQPIGYLFKSIFWIELGLNSIMAPVVFAILKAFKLINLQEKDF